MRIIFYNNYHNGDLHFSLGFCRALVRALGLSPEQVSYAHKCNFANALSGQEDWLGSEIRPIPEMCSDHQSVGLVNDTNTGQKIVFINTWCGQEPALFEGCNFNTSSKIFSKIFEYFKVAMPSDLKDLLPEGKIWPTHRDPEHKLAILCNGQVHSGQAPNSSINFLIPVLREKGYDVLCTAPVLLDKDVAGVYDLSGAKLPEIGAMAASADVIIGRASGPYAFAQTRQTLMDPSKTFISFTHQRADSIWCEFAAAKQVWSNDFDERAMIALVGENT